VEPNAGRTERHGTILGPIIAFCWTVTTIALVIGLGLVAALLTIGDAPSADEKAVTAVWVAVTIGITASVIVILLSIVFASVLLRGLSRALPLFGASPVDRLLGLGATILLFRTTVSLLFSSALGIVFWVWRIIPDTLSRAIIPMVTNSQQLARPDFKFKMASLILDELSREVASISRGSFVRFPFAELLLGLAVWALCGQLLQIVPDQAEGPQRLRLAQLAGRMSRVTWLNTLLFALIGMALYFSTAAIVAVPTLKEFNDPSTPTTQALQSRLKDMESPTAKAEFDAEFPENYGADDTSLSALKTYLDQREADLTKAGGLPSAKKDAFKQLRSEIQGIEQSRDDTLSKWKSLRKTALERNHKIIADALANFESASDVGNGKKERVEYSQELQGWCEERWAEIRSQLRSAKEFINRMNRASGAVAAITRSNLEQALTAPEAKGEAGEASVALFRLTFPMRGWTVPDSLFVLENAFFVPSPPNPGLSLGPFRLFAGWLIETRSLPLAMIIGMLGFGLLGSAVSTFVREQEERNAGDPLVGEHPLVGDLAGVLIRGLSAAIIVFLAAVGGLAILGTGQSDPNPYVLFLGCLVGAVYSQEVWNWARGRVPRTPPGGGDDGQHRHEQLPQDHNRRSDEPPQPEVPAEPEHVQDAMPVPEVSPPHTIPDPAAGPGMEPEHSDKAPPPSPVEGTETDVSR